MVVNTVAQDQARINFLRTQNVGHASFTVLDKISTDRINEQIQTPENVPRLYDPVKPKDTKFLPAFYKALWNTLVVDDLDQANRIAFGGSKQWRVVILAGQMINSSSMMSGGGNHVARGGMSFKLVAEAVRREALRQYERENDEAVDELDEAMKMKALGALERAGKI